MGAEIREFYDPGIDAGKGNQLTLVTLLKSSRAKCRQDTLLAFYPEVADTATAQSVTS